ncbi:hypothetical protein HZH66_012275 [Vespula vulgaris]|uniref:Uncharacterized protein n=2 Tax=Vespula TaxID=7451 RepID=A0A834KLG6_VESPE|nr:hypothetical protein HZH66_012275 [Vespula vulgaris]KAF7406979.1 hypothetical protein H0235_014635 [Vespula pensylvanica]
MRGKVMGEDKEREEYGGLKITTITIFIDLFGTTRLPVMTLVRDPPHLVVSSPMSTLFGASRSSFAARTGCNVTMVAHYRLAIGPLLSVREPERPYRLWRRVIPGTPQDDSFFFDGLPTEPEHMYSACRENCSYWIQ